MSEVTYEGRLPNGESPYVKTLGFLRLRIPFVHVKVSWVEAITAPLICAVYFAAKPLMMNNFGMTAEQALAIIFLSVVLYAIHPFLGDQMAMGWVTSMIPLVLAFCKTYPIGLERTYALISVQLWVAILLLVLGITRLGGPLVRKIPNSIKAGILLGSGLASMYQMFLLTDNPQHILKHPFTIGIGTVVCLSLVWGYTTILNASKKGGIWKLVFT